MYNTLITRTAKQYNNQSIPGTRSRTKCVKVKDRNLKAKTKKFGLKAKARTPITGNSWAICKSAPRPRHKHASIPPLSFYRPYAIPDTSYYYYLTAFFPGEPG